VSICNTRSLLKNDKETPKWCRARTENYSTFVVERNTGREQERRKQRELGRKENFLSSSWIFLDGWSVIIQFFAIKETEDTSFIKLSPILKKVLLYEEHLYNSTWKKVFFLSNSFPNINYLSFHGTKKLELFVYFTFFSRQDCDHFPKFAFGLWASKSSHRPLTLGEKKRKI
jgi:hypothetical protein